MAAFKIAVISAVLLSLCSSLSVAQSPASPETMQVLRNIETSINHEINPCDNFYEYACGNFKNIPDEDVSTSLITLQTKNFENVLVDALERDFSSQPQDPTIMDKLGIFYESCKNRRGFELIKYLDEIKPATGVEWPLLEEMYAGEAAASSWSAHKVDIFDLAARLHSYGIKDVLFDFLFMNAEHGILFAYRPGDLQAQEVDDILREFRLPYDTLAKYRDEILQVHHELKSTMEQLAPSEETEVLNYNEFQRAHPIFAKLYEVSMPNVGSKYANFVYVTSTRRFVTYLADKLANDSEKRRFCNFIMIQFLRKMKEYHNEDCRLELRTKLKFAAEYLYYETEYMPKAQEHNDKLSELIRNVFRSFWDLVNENRMNFNATQVEYLRMRLKKISFNIGNLPQDVNIDTVEEFYKDLGSMDISNYYKNDLLTLKQAHRNDDTRRIEPVWDYFGMFDITAYNVKDLAKVIMPFASMEMPAFHPQLDDLFLLTGLGLFLGHELTHSIDHDIWRIMNVELFRDDRHVIEALDCLSQQRPSSHMQERICDFAGTRMAYNAYSRKQNPQPYYTNTPWEKLFFLNIAQWFCSKIPDIDDMHDTPEIRILQIVQNSEEFATAFQCPVGSRMNPAHKCHFY